MSLTCMMSRWLIPGEAAVIHAAHSGLSAAKDNGQNKAGERAAGGGSPRRSAALGPHSYLIGESPPHYLCMPPGCTPIWGWAALGEAVLAREATEH